MSDIDVCHNGKRRISHFFYEYFFIFFKIQFIHRLAANDSGNHLENPVFSTSEPFFGTAAALAALRRFPEAKFFLPSPPLAETAHTFHTSKLSLRSGCYRKYHTALPDSHREFFLKNRTSLQQQKAFVWMCGSRRADCSRRPVRPFLIPDVARLDFCNFPVRISLFKIGCRIWKHFMIHLTDIRQKRLPVKVFSPSLCSIR